MSQLLKTDQENDSLEKDLSVLFNKYGIDKLLNTPDFLLAQYIMRIFAAQLKLDLQAKDWRSDK